jgi:hypothetical protein
VETTERDARVTLKQNHRTTTLELLTPGAHETEFLVPKESDALTVTASVPASLQLAMRRAEEPPLAPQRMVHLPSNETPTLTPKDQREALQSERVGARLPHLAALSSALRSEANLNERVRLSQQRALELVALGYKQLGQRDLVAQEPTASDRDVALVLGARDSIIPANLTGKLAPLEQPADTTSLAARRARLQQEGPIGCSQDITDALIQRADAESLLAAYCAERVPLPAVAAQLYEALGKQRGLGDALLRAATLYVDAATTDERSPLAMHAAILLTYASSQGQDTSSVWARLAPAVAFRPIPLLEQSLGYVPLLRSQSRDRTLKEQLVATLTQAVPDALLLSTDETAELQWNQALTSTLELDYGCDAGRGEPCALESRIDGLPVVCAELEPRRRCQLSVPAGRHRLEFRFAGLESLGWLKLAHGSTELVPSLLTRWHLLSPTEPARLSVRGPTILRLQFRVQAPYPSTQPQVRISGCGAPESLASLELPLTTDRTVKSASQDGVEVTLPVTVELPIEARTPCMLSLQPTERNTLAYLAVARVQGLPRERDLVSRSLEDPSAGAGAASKLVSDELPVTQAPVPPAAPRVSRFPLLLGGRARLLSESLQAITEQDGSSASSTFSDVFLETLVLAHRELVPNRLWGGAQIGTRFRDGPMSEVARLSLDLPARPYLPGVELDGALVAQRLASEAHLTASSTAKLSSLLPLTSSASFVPQVGYTNTHVTQAPARVDGVDGDLYSTYLAEHPHYASVMAQLNTRPFVDAQSSFSLSARTLPNLDALDRLTGAARLLFLPRPDWPLLVSAEWATSLRFASALRDDFFIRHQFTTTFGLWTWLSPADRFRLFGQLDCFFDAPASRLRSPVVAPLLGLELTTSGARGLRDLAPSQVPFRTFQQRGSAP